MVLTANGTRCGPLATMFGLQDAPHKCAWGPRSVLRSGLSSEEGHEEIVHSIKS